MAEFGVQNLDDVNLKNLTRSERKKRKYQAAFFDNHSGGYYVCQKGHEYNREEIEAARYLALNGFRVKMQPEGDGSGGVSLRLSKRGGNTYPEGKIGSLWYEQYSALGGAPMHVKRGIIHAHEKGVAIAVIYDKNLKLSRHAVDAGIRMYKTQPTTYPKSVQQVLYITKLPNSRRWGVFKWHL